VTAAPWGALHRHVDELRVAPEVRVLIELYEEQRKARELEG
jgi:hypothetical protein